MKILFPWCIATNWKCTMKLPSQYIRYTALFLRGFCRIVCLGTRLYCSIVTLICSCTTAVRLSCVYCSYGEGARLFF